MPTKTRLILLCSASLLAGCVSMGTYRALQRQNDDLRSRLGSSAQEAGSLETDLGTAKQTSSDLAARNGDLEQSQADLANEDTALSAQKDALEKEKAALQEAALQKQAQYDSVMGDLKQEVNDGQLKITLYQNMLALDVADQILFDSGKARLKEHGKAVLRMVAKALAKSGKMIRVVGHTDDVPVSDGDRYSDNWELSAARAVTVVRFLQERCGLDPRRLVAEGRGQWMPSASNATARGRHENRSIQIQLIDRSLADGIQVAPATGDRP